MFEDATMAEWQRTAHRLRKYHARGWHLSRNEILRAIRRVMQLFVAGLHPQQHPDQRWRLLVSKVSIEHTLIQVQEM